MNTEFEMDFLVSDKEIRAWMDAEIVRLGEWFKSFTITWHRNGKIHWLELWSESAGDLSRSGIPAGKNIRIGEISTDEDWIPLPILQHEGRKLYHKLKKDYVVHRDLGRT